MTDWWNGRTAAVALAAAGMALRLAGALGRPLTPEEAEYAISGLSLANVEAQLSGSPFFSVLVAIGELIAGTSDIAPRLPALVSSGILLYAAYAIGRRLLQRRAWWLVGLAALSPVLVYVGSSAEPISVALALAALLVMALGRRPSANPWLSGALGGLLLAMGLPGLIMVGLVLTGVLSMRPRIRRDWLFRAIPAMAGAAVIGISGLGLHLDWLAQVWRPGQSVSGSPSDPIWYGLLIPVVYGLVTALFGLIGLWRLRFASSPLANGIGGAALVAFVIVMVSPDRGPAVLAAWQFAWLPLAAIGLASAIDGRSLTRGVRNPWILVPFVSAIFAFVAASWVAQGGAVSAWQLLGAGAAVVLPLLLLAALIVFAKTTAESALAVLFIAALIFEVHTLTSLNYGESDPDLLVRSRGSQDGERVIRVAEGSFYARYPLAAAPGVPELEWLAAKRHKAAPIRDADGDQLRLSLVAGPSDRLLAAGVLNRTWTGRFTGFRQFFVWLTSRRGVHADESRFFLTIAE